MYRIEMSRMRAWCFTSYNEKQVPEWNSERMKYLLYAPEKCPDTGRFHYQGYVYYKDKVSIKKSQELLNSGKHHHEPASAGPQENYLYIAGPYEKDGKIKPYNPDYKEHGEQPKQGKRVDLDELKEKILKNETTIDSVVVDTPQLFHQYGRTLERLDDLRMSKLWRTEMTEGLWIYGPTAVGKSHLAFENYHPDTHYLVPNDGDWWDEYKQQETVIFNDFRGTVPYNELLQMVDKWPYHVRRRGRCPLPFISKKVIITSSLHPRSVYKNRNENDELAQLLRRFEVKKIHKWEGGGNGEEYMSDEEMLIEGVIAGDIPMSELSKYQKNM
jgi:hypothetical protein